MEWKSLDELFKQDYRVLLTKFATPPSSMGKQGGGGGRILLDFS